MELIDIVKRQLGKKNVQLTDRLLEDLGAESADLVNIIATIEETYDIAVSDEEIADISTVSDLYDLLQSHQS